MTLRVLDLFSGIGAYALGVERAGMKVVAFCESEEFPRRVLRKHWPDVPIYEDVRTLNADTLRRDGIAVDVIVGGWPCQDISVAGSGLGLDGARSGLWSEVARLAGEIRPRFLLLENSSNLLGLDGGRWFSRILGDLAALGFDAEWHCLSAAAFDAPHIRDRVFITAVLANADIDIQRRSSSPGSVRGESSAGEDTKQGPDRKRRRHAPGRRRAGVSDANSEGLEICIEATGIRSEAPAGQPRSPAERVYAFADANGARPLPCSQPGIYRGEESSGSRHEQSERRFDPAYADSIAPIGTAIARAERHTWLPEPDVVRVVHGAPNRVDRIHALGNCNPPIIIETLARALIAMGLKAAQSQHNTDAGGK